METGGGDGIERGPQRAHADVVGAGVEVRAHARRHVVRVARRNHRVDEPVAAAVGELAFGEAEALKVVAVIGQAEVGPDERAGELASTRGGFADDDRLLDGEYRSRAERRPGE